MAVKPNIVGGWVACDGDNGTVRMTVMRWWYDSKNRGKETEEG